MCKGYPECEPALTKIFSPFNSLIFEFCKNVRDRGWPIHYHVWIESKWTVWKMAVMCCLGKMWALNYMLTEIRSLTGYSMWLALIQPSRNDRADKKEHGFVAVANANLMPYYPGSHLFMCHNIVTLVITHHCSLSQCSVVALLTWRCFQTIYIFNTYCFHV